MEGSLFRSEVLDAPSQAWLGTVRLATPVSTQAWTVAALLIGAAILAWLFAGHYTQRVHVTGLLVPRAGLISLTANTVGVVDHVAAAEGDRVVAGQILVSLSGEHTSKALGNTAAGVSTQLQRQAGSLRQDIGDALTLRDKQAEDNRAQQTLLKDQLAQIDAQIAIEKKQMALVQDLVNKWSGLVAGGYIPALQVEQEQSALLADESQLRSLQQQHAGTRQQLSALDDQLTQLPLAVSAKLNELRRQLAQVEQALAQNEATRASELRAPASGIVSSLLVKPGASVSLGQPLLAIVPDGSRLQAQLLVPSQAVGFVHPGVEVTLHYQAFPYQKFGLQHGVVRSVSRSALMPGEVTLLLGGGTPPSTDSLYLARVDLANQNVQAYGQQQPLRPGMALEADMLLDRRRIVEWIFEPLYGMGHRWSSGS
ncbi:MULTISPECIES: HlyD family efflux transporter periplasmic adaptor subunit [Xanthomonas]|jgi:membrane fusion protein|uniref:HlyD family efflux transporter periplasmic adaptor subunit n=1 Tax=Xanthomonas TaxID=338 RepID=UPI0002A79723|nr:MULTISPECIES: HlyD family efflux transporter periplasmic adaptor subunit [Xanthomonas]AVY67257.1 anibiotic ABC transporter [Xanthomonas translucens pv. undulosa]ELQ07208.1 membrane fusion transmembrane protein [Xanthomonas translucens DAR61454]MCT8281456.1 HlyD family efflux transporter periplasmic adaptor subunit [Xanthomonas translucens pv. undulosa]MCT8316218.1 HlyD family efflux transporter periplasmic adaptor subunit [Xanthomonas translucens pv. undulosa]NYF18910.1 membrane fusion prot